MAIFDPCFLALFHTGFARQQNELINYAKEHMSNPDDMALRIRIKQFCDEKKIPHPNFPPGGSGEEEHQPLHIALENENFLKWFSAQKSVWHTHKGVNEFHLNCQCKKCHQKNLHCPALRFPAMAVINIIKKSISSRGRFFVFNDRIKKCLETKIIIEKGQFNFIQTTQQFCFQFSTDIQAAAAGCSKLNTPSSVN